MFYFRNVHNISRIVASCGQHDGHSRGQWSSSHSTLHCHFLSPFPWEGISISPSSPSSHCISWHFGIFCHHQAWCQLHSVPGQWLWGMCSTLKVAFHLHFPQPPSTVLSVISWGRGCLGDGWYPPTYLSWHHAQLWQKRAGNAVCGEEHRIADVLPPPQCDISHRFLLPYMTCAPINSRVCLGNA